jgi:nicotinamidase-related amidase
MTGKRIWDAFLTEQDKTVFAASGFGAVAGFGARPALLVIDVVRDHFGDGRAPLLSAVDQFQDYCGPESWDCVDVIERLAMAFRAKALPVIYSVPRAGAEAWHPAPQSYRYEGEALPVPAEQQVIARLRPQKQDIVFPKLKPSAFFSTNLNAYLTFLEADSIIVVGAETSDAVRSTVNDAFSQNYRIIIVEDGCCDQSQASHALNLCDMHAKYGDVVASGEILDWVATLPTDLFPRLPRP